MFVHHRLLSPQLCFRQLGIRNVPFGFGSEECLGKLSPITIHHVRLVKLDLEEEGGSRSVRRCVVASLSRPGSNCRAYDKPFDRDSVPFPGLSDFLSILANLALRIKHEGRRLDKAPFLGKRIDDWLSLSVEFANVGVEAMEMKTGHFRRDAQDVLFKRVVTQFCNRRPILFPQSCSQLLACLSGLFEMRIEPPFAHLSMTLLCACNRTERMF